MATGIALVLIFVLYLIDKHNRWRQAFKLTVGLAVLGVLGVSGFYGWEKYQGYQQEKRQKIQAAEWLAKFDDCVSRLKQLPVPTDEADADVDVNINGACTFDSKATQYVYQPVKLTPDRLPSESKPKLKTPSQQQIDWSKYAKPPNCQVVVCAGWAVVTSEYESRIASRNCFDTDFRNTMNCGTIAVLKKGDRVQILSEKVRAPDGFDMYETKFQQWTGWVNASDLSPEKGNR